MVTLTSEVSIEPSHQVEGCFLFWGALAPCLSFHPVSKTMNWIPPAFMGTLRGHLKQPQERLHLPLLLPFLSLPSLGEASLKRSLERWTPDNDSSETVSQTERKISPSCSPLASLSSALSCSNKLQAQCFSCLLSSLIVWCENVRDAETVCVCTCASEWQQHSPSLPQHQSVLLSLFLPL